MDSIIFDLDGTLWDSRETVVTAWNRAIEEYEHADRVLTTDDLKATMGLQMQDIMKELFPKLTEEQQAELIARFSEKELPHIEQTGGALYPGLEETLETLKENYRLFIVSNCQDGYIEAFFKAHGLSHFFEDYENPGRTGLSKGENIRLVMERNGLKEPVYVGDTSGDARAAHEADVPFVFARYGFGDVSEYAYVIDDLPALTARFK